MNSYRQLIISISWSILLINCANQSKDLYYWGRYEDAIYKMYLEPGQTSVSEEILLFEKQIEKAQSQGKPAPPGLHAHIAHLNYSIGNYDNALLHFEMEKELFPEASKFIDGILARMKK